MAAITLAAGGDQRDGRGSREEKVIRYWLTLVSGLGTAYT